MQSAVDSTSIRVKELSRVENAAERVVFAIGQETKKHFLGNFPPAKLPPAEYEWIDISGLGRDRWEKILTRLDPTVLVTGWGTPAIPDNLARSPQLALRYVCHLGGSVKSVVPRHLLSRGVLVTNWGSVISYTIAEHAILLVLGALRGMPLWRPCFEAGSCGVGLVATSLRTRSLRGQRVGLHGFGAIAREIVGMLKAFRVTISAWSAGVPADLFTREQVRQCSSLEELFSTNDIVIGCEALTPGTAGTVTEAILRLLPEDAVFVNVGRGAVVDEEALAKLASEKKLRVGLDVFQQEPLPASSPLLAAPSALLSPHIAGPTNDVLPLCGEFALKNIHSYLAGERTSLEGRVTLDIYDRST